MSLKLISTLQIILHQIKFKPKQTKPIVLTAVTAIPILIQSMSAVHINTNLQIIQTELNITSQQASWILNIETIMTIVFITLTSKLSERYGATKIMLSGTIINSFFNMLFVSKRLSQKYVAILILRALAAAGIGLMVPSQMPVNVILVQTGKLPIAIALCSMMVPVGSIFGAMIAGLVAKSIGWYNMCTIIASIGTINCICQSIFLPFNLPSNSLAKINFLGFFLIASGVTAFLFGLVTLNDRSLVPLYASIIILLCGLTIICIFFVYDIRYARVKIFSREIWNRTLIISEIILLLTCTVSYGERYFNSYQLAGNLNVHTSIVGVLLAITGISVFVFSPITNIMQKKLVSKYCIRIFLASYAAILLLNALSIKFFPGIGQYVFYTFLDVGFYVGVIIVAQSYNYAQTPLRFSQQIGGLNALMQCLGQALGVALSVVIAKSVHTAAERSGSGAFIPGSISVTLLVYVGTLIAGIALSFILGVFRFERGRKGFSETAFMKTRTFSDNKINNADMIEVETFEDGTSGNYKNNVIQYFSLYNVPEIDYNAPKRQSDQIDQEWAGSGLNMVGSGQQNVEDEAETFKLQQKYHDVQF